MKVKAVKGYVCPECEEFVPLPAKTELTTRYQCGECEELYEDRDDALECCRE